MAKLRTRKVSTTVGGVKGKEMKVELESLGNGQRFRLIAVGVFTLIYIASLVQPSIVDLGLFDKRFADGQQWRVISYAFLHGNWPHLIMNMLACFMFARVVEMHYGRKAMVAIFIVTSVCAAVPEMMFRPELQMVGASGGLMGLWGAQVAAAFRLRQVPKSFRKLTEQLSLGSLVGYFALQVVLDHVIPHVAYWAHLGGFASGLVLGAVLPLFGACTIVASRRGIVLPKEVTVHDVVGTTEDDRYQSLTLCLQDSFEPNRDFVVVVRDRLGFMDRHYTTTELLSGVMGYKHSPAWQNSVVVASPTYLEGIGDPQVVLSAVEKAEADAAARARAKA